MSELAEIRKMLTEVRDMGVATANDIKWIKDGMSRGTKRMDDHDTEIARLHKRQNTWAGGGTIIGTIIGAVLSVFIHRASAG